MTAVFIVSAPSGSGKSTLVNRLLKLDSRLRFSISYTTRAPRGAEENGKDYHFVTREDFEARLDREEFLEWAEVFGNYYGTHRSCYDEAVARGEDLLLDIDVQGARKLKDRIPDAATIFILPPSREVLEQRLRSRSEDTEQVIRRRLAEAAREIRNYERYDYVLVNREVERSVAGLAAIVQGERLRRSRQASEIAPVLATFADYEKEDSPEQQ